MTTSGLPISRFGAGAVHCAELHPRADGSLGVTRVLQLSCPNCGVVTAPSPDGSLLWPCGRDVRPDGCGALVTITRCRLSYPPRIRATACAVNVGAGPCPVCETPPHAIEAHPEAPGRYLAFYRCGLLLSGLPDERPIIQAPCTAHAGEVATP